MILTPRVQSVLNVPVPRFEALTPFFGPGKACSIPTRQYQEVAIKVGIAFAGRNKNSMKLGHLGQATTLHTYTQLQTSFDFNYP